jgi:hypothetical protein
MTRIAIDVEGPQHDEQRDAARADHQADAAPALFWQLEDFAKRVAGRHHADPRQ